MILFVIFVILCIIYWSSTRDGRIERMIAQFPGPPAYPLFGNVFNYFTNDLLEMQRRQKAATEKYGGIFRLKFFRFHIISTSDPKIFQTIAKNCLGKSKDYGLLKPVIGDGLVTSLGYLWQSHRKAIQPAFSTISLRKYVEIFDGKCKSMVDELKSHCDGTKIDVDVFTKQLSSDIAMKTLMGIDKKNEKTLLFERALARTKLLLFAKTMDFWKLYDVLFAIFASSQKNELENCQKIINEYAIDVIQQRRKHLMKIKQNKVDESMECIVDILLQSTIDGLTMSDKEIFDEVKTILIAGQETTSYAISSTLFLLSRNSHIQTKLWTEISETIGSDSASEITHEHLLNLKYMDMVIQESMRFYPPVMLIGRYVDHDLKLDDGRIIPAGVDVKISFDIMMMNAKYFPNPSHFDPERFASGHLHQEQLAYFPFSVGKRDCIGKKFAILNIKTALCRVLQNFELIAMGDEPIIRNEITAQSINGFQMALTPRKQLQ